MVHLPKIIPRAPSYLSLRFKPSDFKYKTLLDLDIRPNPSNDARGCSRRPQWKTMTVRMRIVTVTLLVAICLAIQLCIILLVRGYYKSGLPDSIKYPWRQFPE